MQFYAFQIAASMIAYYFYRNNKLRYFAVITTIYFLSYFMAGSFDIALSLYCLMVFLGTGFPEKMRMGGLLVCIWIIAYALVGIFFQNAFMTMTALITRYSYILIFICVLAAKKTTESWNPDTKDYRFMVRLGLVTEVVIILLVWLRHGFGARVVTNNQPIGAGIVIGLTAIIGWCYLTKQFSAMETAIYCILSVIVVVLSGTRGYMLIIAFPMAIVLIMFLLDVPNRGKQALLRIGIICIATAFLIIGLFALGYIEELIQMLRLNESLGYRENENAFVKQIISYAPWYHKIFGFGLGGNASHVDGFLTAVQRASWNRSFMYEKLLTRTIFHNYWYTVIFKQGLMGIVFVSFFYIGVFKKIHGLKTSLWLRSLLHAMLLGNIISLTFHITATCSIFEMLLIAFFVGIFEDSSLLAGKEETDSCELLQKQEFIRG